MPVCWEQSFWICTYSVKIFVSPSILSLPPFLATGKDIQYCTVYSISHDYIYIYIKAPPPTERRAQLCQWRKHILRSEGGISCAMLRKCSPLGQIRWEPKMPGPLLLVYFMVWPDEHCYTFYALLVPAVMSNLTRRRDWGNETWGVGKGGSKGIILCLWRNI